MDPKKAEMKNVGNKLAEESLENTNKDMSKELENLNKLATSKEPQTVIKIKEHDIELLKNELGITYEEAKNNLINCKGDINNAIEIFLNDFNIIQGKIYILKQFLIIIRKININIHYKCFYHICFQIKYGRKNI